MKLQTKQGFRKGFTLVELLVAMTVTVLIITALVTITSVAMNTWNRSRAELRASRQAKAMIEVMAKDFESMVTRRGNTFEWMAVKTLTGADLPGTAKLSSTNASEIVLLTSPMDRYDGDLADDDSKGDVSGVGYVMEFKDPITGEDGSDFKTFVINRHLVDPDETFLNLLGKEDLLAAFAGYQAELEKPEHFVCENVYQFTVVFHVEVSEPPVPPATASTTKTVLVPVNSLGVTEFRFKGTGIETVGAIPSSVTQDTLKAGRMKGVELSLTVLTDAGANRVRRGAVPANAEELAKFLSGNSFNYSKFIPLASL